MSTSIDDDEDGSFKPGLESIMEASLLDDCGGRRDLFDRIMEYFRTWNSCRDNNRPMGCDSDVYAIQMAGQKVQSTITFVSTLPEVK